MHSKMGTRDFSRLGGQADGCVRPMPLVTHTPPSGRQPDRGTASRVVPQEDSRAALKEPPRGFCRRARSWRGATHPWSSPLRSPFCMVMYAMHPTVATRLRLVRVKIPYRNVLPFSARRIFFARLRQLPDLAT
jgi:hypothetical protein